MLITNRLIPSLHSMIPGLSLRQIAMALFSRAITLFASGCGIIFTAFSNPIYGDNAVVTIYPTYGYQQDNKWIIPLRLWVHERRSVAEAVAGGIVAGVDDVTPEEVANFRSRSVDFLADSKSRDEVTLTFDADPLNEKLQVADSMGRAHKSDLNGLIEGTISLTQDRAISLLRVQQSQHGWLSLSVTSKDHSGDGRVRLVDQEGISVISDIDDTIKVTELPAGPEIVVRNTFLHPFRAAPEMSMRYEAWKDASFHYVSGGPWQMYDPLAEFLIDGKAGFPEGSFHMKTVRKNLFSMASWRDLTELVTNSEMTFEHKVTQITTLMERFPRRQFILVGDSGEKDPEVYQVIRMKFSAQVREIWIRDIVNDRENNPDRLSGMRIIPAATVTRGVSEFIEPPLLKK